MKMVDDVLDFSSISYIEDLHNRTGFNKKFFNKEFVKIWTLDTTTGVYTSNMIPEYIVEKEEIILVPNISKKEFVALKHKQIMETWESIVNGEYEYNIP